ncbi:MAG: PLP-dependent aminotransferase family protein [Aureispira sp.]
MLPYKNLIVLEHQRPQALYLQIVDAFSQFIQQGQLVAGNQLPSSRVLSKLLEVHRNTISMAYEELEAQGWVEIQPKRGVFVHQQIPLLQSRNLGQNPTSTKQLGYTIHPVSFIQPIVSEPKHHLAFDDGVPDVRLAPLAALGRAYRVAIQRPSFRKELEYGSTLGSMALRQVLQQHLQATRGIQIEQDQLMITRGSIMGLYLVAQLLLKKGDTVVVGALNYQTANSIFQQAGAQLLTIPVDEKGIVVGALESICQQQRISAIYVASHHHHPTTVTLSADRRLQLLALAQQYQFALIEDDYDYDYHYQRNPILPLASIDSLQQVIYIGSMSKALAPAFRVGFVAAHPQLIQQMGTLRRIIDRQGDFPLEKAIASLFQAGDIQRHLRKALRIYKERRDGLVQLLEQQLEGALSFDIPKGGMAIWAKFDPSIDLYKTGQQALKKGLLFRADNYYTPNFPPLQATRLGFASLNLAELEEATHILQQSLVLKKN